MGWIQVHENTKVPILKNIAYALKILFKCSKTFMLWQVIAMVSSMLFTNFLQSVLFLKALLSVIEGGYDFAYYAKTVLACAVELTKSRTPPETGSCFKPSSLMSSALLL